MAITTEQIKQLRDETGISVMQCKKALEEAGGDMEKALVILRKNSKTIAAKKSERTLNAGVVECYIHASGTVGAMVELSCETDFVAKTDGFRALAREIAMHVAASDPKYLSKQDVPADARAAAEEVFLREVEGKPENLRVQILDGKLASYFRDLILLEQPYIKNPDITVKGLIEEAVQKFGEKTEIARFARFAVGK